MVAVSGPPETTAFPPEVEFILSAMEAGPRPVVDRHRERRTPYRVVAALRLYSDAHGTYRIYTRQVNSTAIGILSDRALPLSHGGILTITSPAGRAMHIACTVLRCRQAAPGWYEGALHFNREQTLFAADNMAAPS